jgi:histidinol phosphatase-like PHP family hydrolase
MKAIYDYHIHTHHIGCANETMQIPDIIDECSKLGLESIAMTDHLNHLAQVEQHRKIKEDLSNYETKLKVHFGVEISCVKNNQPYNEKIKESCGFSFTIAGVHNAYEHGFNQKKLLSAHHQLHMMAMTDPLVDILAHPYRLFESELSLIERLAGYIRIEVEGVVGDKQSKAWLQPVWLSN